MAEVAEKKEHPRGVARTIWVLQHFHDVASGSPVETAVINLLNRVLLVLILVESMHTVVLSLRPRAVAQLG